MMDPDLEDLMAEIEEQAAPKLACCKRTPRCLDCVEFAVPQTEETP